MKTKNYDRWDLDVTFAGTTVHAVYQNFSAHSKIEAEIRGLAHARLNNSRAVVLKVKATPSENREKAEAKEKEARERLARTGGELWREALA